MARHDLTEFEEKTIQPLLRTSPVGFPGLMTIVS